MAQRICDACGKLRDVQGGKTCEKGHFICKSCAYTGTFFPSARTTCPLDQKPLR